MLVTSIFFFSHNVYERIFPPIRPKSSLCGNGLKIAKKCFGPISASSNYTGYYESIFVTRALNAFFKEKSSIRRHIVCMQHAKRVGWLYWGLTPL